MNEQNVPSMSSLRSGWTYLKGQCLKICVRNFIKFLSVLVLDLHYSNVLAKSLKQCRLAVVYLRIDDPEDKLVVGKMQSHPSDALHRVNAWGHIEMSPILADQ
jgi:hypothetical protein